MRSPSGSRRYTRRVRRYVSFPTVTIAACAILVAAAGCSNKGAPLTQGAPPTVAEAAPGIPLYSVESRNLGFDAMPSIVPANRQFQLAFTNNETFKTTDDLVVLRLPPGKTAQDVVDDAKKKGVKAEGDWASVGDSGSPLPVHASTVVTLDLPPGNYVATSWLTGKAGGGTGPPHVAMGMIAPFTASVAAGADATAAPAGPMYSVSVKNFTFVGMPATVPANRPIAVTFINDDAFTIRHEFVVLRLPPGDTAQNVVDDAIKKGAKAEDDWVHVGDSGAALPIGASAVIRLDLKPGNYLATCWQTGKEGGGTGRPHLMIGMITPFTAVSR
jgi:hypothetical protein